MPAWLRHLPAVLGLGLLAAAVWVVQNEFRSLSLEDIKAALAAIPSHRLWMAFGLTLAAYAILTVYDRLGTIYAGRAVGYGRAAFASFCAYTLAHNIGFAAVSGAAVRYRLYAQWGLSPLQIGKVVAFCSLTFILGGIVLGGIVLLVDPFVLPVLGDRLPRPLMQGLGVALLAMGVGYVALCGLLRRVRVRGHDVDLPSWPLATAQMVLASVDMAVTAGILHVLLPPMPGLSFVGFVGIYVTAYLAGLLANIPGGIGIFDTAILLGLSPFLDAPSVVGGIVVFRLFYYIVPLFLAGVLFAGNEVLMRGRGMFARTATLPAVQTLARWSPPEFEVAAIAGAVALCGALLLALGAIDALGDYSWLGPGWRLPDWAQSLLGPASEFVPSLIGAALMVLSLALTRRATLAWGLTIALLLLGACFTAARGADGWVSAVLLVAALLLSPFRRLFYRNARLFSGPLDASRAAAPLLLAGSVLVLATYEPRLTMLAHASWWQVVLSPDLPNTVRASVGLAVLVGCAAIWRLARPGRVVAQPWSVATDAALRALGGTSVPLPEGLLWGEAGRAAIPLRRIPGILLAMGDPVGSHADRISAIWRLRDLAVQEGRHLAVWRVGAALRPVYADIGLSSLPLGADGLPALDDEAEAYLACRPELDLPTLLPLLSSLAAEREPA